MCTIKILGFHGNRQSLKQTAADLIEICKDTTPQSESIARTGLRIRSTNVDRFL